MWCLVQAALASNAHQLRSSEWASSATKWNTASKGHQNALAPQDNSIQAHSLNIHCFAGRPAPGASRYNIKCTSSDALRVLIQPPSGEQATKGIQMPLSCRTKSMTHISWSNALQIFAPSACHHAFTHVLAASVLVSTRSSDCKHTISHQVECSPEAHKCSVSHPVDTNRTWHPNALAKLTRPRTTTSSGLHTNTTRAFKHMRARFATQWLRVVLPHRP